jgi:hypothetical protein
MWHEAQRQRVLAQHKLFEERASCQCPAVRLSGICIPPSSPSVLRGARRGGPKMFDISPSLSLSSRLVEIDAERNCWWGPAHGTVGSTGKVVGRDLTAS